MKRNYSIQILRFLSCFVIVSYHVYSYFLRDNDLPNFFCRGYIADEFFFMVSGFFLAFAAVRADSDERWPIRYVLKRIGKIAFPYYVTWIFCFIGCRIADYLAGDPLDIGRKLINSIYELTFLEMCGFVKGEYSNLVGWFFSALVLSMLIVCPLAYKFKLRYALYAAPVIGFFLLGMLSMQFDYLYYPHKIIPGFPAFKGLLRALADIHLGVFAYGLYDVLSGKRFTAFGRRILTLLNVLLWCAVFGFWIFPFGSNTVETPYQFDYLFIVVLFFAFLLTAYLGEAQPKEGSRYQKTADVLGKISVYVFLGQPIFYTVRVWYFGLPIRTLIKVPVFYLAVIFFSALIYVIDVSTKGLRTSLIRKMTAPAGKRPV